MSLVLVLTACSSAPQQLEAVAVSAPAFDDDPSEPPTWSGTAAVTGSERDWSIDLETDEQAHAFSVHSPSAMQLSALDGEELTVRVTTTWSGNPDGLAVYDAVDLAYASVGSVENADVLERFGADFASWGDELGRSRGEQATYTYKAIAFATDEGTVELAPGEVAEIVVHGVTWLAAPVASYDHEYHKWAAVPACGGGGPMLSYELFRMDEATGESRFVERAEGSAMAKRSCG